MNLDHRVRYLQIAFNHNLSQARRIVFGIPSDKRIIIEVGTPFIKREGVSGVRHIVNITSNIVIADLKTADGAIQEVEMFVNAGVKGVTVLGNSSKETLDYFIDACKANNVISMVDMLGVDEVLPILRKLKSPPDVIILHRGRDEEKNKRKMIPYKEINKIRSKFNCLISAAGGIDLNQARSAVFNGANIVVVNVVNVTDPWTGITSESDVTKVAFDFLQQIK